MRRSDRTSNTASQSLNIRLDRYVLAATAAGVGCFALAQPANAEIVYTQVNQVIPSDTTFNLDLNNDGIVDFELKNHEAFRNSLKADLFMIAVNSSNRAAGEEKYPAALAGGVIIGSVSKFPKNGDGKLAEWFYSFSTTLGPRYFGQWRHAVNRYLGLKFVVDGDIHYGWARLSVTCEFLRPVSAKITGYAYETEPNVSIHAGQTTESGGEMGDAGATESPMLPKRKAQGKSLGMLALGSPAMAMWRREEASSS